LYLLDTDVVSAARRREAPVAAWLATAAGSSHFISVLTVGEIRRGIAKLRPKDPAEARRLAQWLAETIAEFADNILTIDRNVAAIWGDLGAARQRPVVDALIAATALHHGLAVVTRNVRDYADTGVRVVNPWSPAQGTRT
jgi:predicted nucleic acid-binding protein